MSEAVTPQDDARTSTSTPSPVAPDASRRSGTATGLALLALLVGVAGLGAGGWSFWQVQQLQGTERDQLAQLEDARGKTESLAQRNQQLAARLTLCPPRTNWRPGDALWWSCRATSSISASN